MMPSPSRSHCTTAPAMKMLPSSAYSVRLPIRQETVVRRLFLDAIGLVPVFISMKQPVPYVFFTIPGSVHACPNSAACWSPAMPAMGIEPPNNRVSPYTSLEDDTAGSTECGTPNSFSSSSSQSPLRRLNSIVRDALLGSVTCTRPPVKFQTRRADRFLGGVQLRRPDLVRVVLDPARLGKDLAKLLLRRSHDAAAAIEHDRPRAGRALVQGQDVFHAGHHAL